ncbi:MAG: asparagine--tRNA ligase [Alphaproteobacteria bacterium]|nr:asparagine--tRNA ligase [Alphaproteobacteria bacterium]MBO7097266.1 asparagine--tRNA ligase [Alphaproteobacteria bacterium]
MLKRSKIVSLLNADAPQDKVLIKGWVKTRRDAKDFSFIEINDGSCLANMQVIALNTLSNYEDVKKLSTGSSVAVEGALVASQGGNQKYEIQASAVEIYAIAPDDYPLQKKKMTDEYLRSIAHLRPRTNKYGAAFRIRSELSYAIHQFFHSKGFRYVHTPIITGSDCEGAGEMFEVTTFDMQNLPKTKDGKINYAEDFFGKPAHLTVSGQLNGEMYACALGDIYTFGPTFRAENSNTPRHAAEFWMIEPEMAFADLNDDMDVAEDMVRSCVKHIMEHCKEDLALFEKFVDPTLKETLENIAHNSFARVSYTEAIELMKKSGKKFEYAPEYGIDMQTEHERFLAEEYFKKPVIVYNYPKEIKAFYMRLNDDGKTVAAMDVLVPRIGELIGGSQREERYDVLTARIKELGMRLEDYAWYLDSRKYGTVPHAGFGLGFERMMMLVTGISNIRDVIPFPRTPKSVNF